MKIQVLIVLVSIVVAANAKAACFNFVNGEGPSQIGNFGLANTAKSICVQSVGSFGRSYLSVSLNDESGELAVVTGEESATGRCAGFCKQVTLTSGNINGSNVDLSGAQLEFQVEKDMHLGVSKGSLKIQAGRDFPQEYLLIEAR